MRAEIVIIGGGIVGASIAHHLAEAGAGADTIVVERDPSYEWAATPRGSGGIRQLFSLPENIALSAHGLAFYRDFETAMAVDGEPAPIAFREQGYLFLSDGGGARDMEANFRAQAELGVDAQLLDPDQIQALFPSIAVDDVALGVYSPSDAWIDPHAALQGFRRKARAGAVRFVAGDVVAWEADGGLARRVRLASGRGIEGGAFVLAAGAWSGEVARMIGWKIPIEPMSREAHFFRCACEIEELPFIKTETDLAFRPEGNGYTGGVPEWGTPAGWNFELSPDHFERVVWPALARRVPALETLRLERSWRGHYARSRLDLSPIIGPWTGGLANAYLCSGFSGHGIMHAPGAGRAMAELLIAGSYQTIDLAPFGYGRVLDDAPYRERGIV